MFLLFSLFLFFTVSYFLWSLTLSFWFLYWILALKIPCLKASFIATTNILSHVLHLDYLVYIKADCDFIYTEQLNLANYISPLSNLTPRFEFLNTNSSKQPLVNNPITGTLTFTQLTAPILSYLLPIYREYDGRWTTVGFQLSSLPSFCYRWNITLPSNYITSFR